MDIPGPNDSAMVTGVSMRVLVCAALLLGTLGTAAHADDEKSAALAVMDEFLRAFNARDPEAWADTLLYPHVRLASGTVTIYPDRAAFIAAMRLEVLAATEGWDRSTWDSREIVQSSADKVHVATVFSRYHADGSRYATYKSLYVVEKVDGHWGIRARSSFAP
jgi:Domain of unknown function (DUF4440)